MTPAASSIRLESCCICTAIAMAKGSIKLMKDCISSLFEEEDNNEMFCMRIFLSSAVSDSMACLTYEISVKIERN